METPPIRISPLYCITYAEVNNERDIPHRIKSYHDSAYDGIYQAQKGWGVVEAPLSYKEEIISIYRDLPVTNQPPPEDED